MDDFVVKKRTPFGISRRNVCDDKGIKFEVSEKKLNELGMKTLKFGDKCQELGEMDVDDANRSFKANTKSHKNRPKASGYEQNPPTVCEISSPSHLGPKMKKLEISKTGDYCWIDTSIQSNTSLDESHHDSGISTGCDDSSSSSSSFSYKCNYAGMPIDFSNFIQDENQKPNISNTSNPFNLSSREPENFRKNVRKFGKAGTTSKIFGIRKTPPNKNRNSKIPCIIEEETCEFSFSETCSSNGSLNTSNISILSSRKKFVKIQTPPKKIGNRKKSKTPPSKKMIFPHETPKLRAQKSIDKEESPKKPRLWRSLSETNCPNVLLDQSCNSDDENYKDYCLKTIQFPKTHNPCFGCINGETMAEILKLDEFNEKFALIDCRYGYEYKAGHIENAINITSPQTLINYFYPSDENEFNKMRFKIPIFYCEFSQKRGPGMARELRRADRLRNTKNYPNIDYPEIYILEDGYSGFFKTENYREHCTPQGYISMFDPKYQDEAKKYPSAISKSLVKTTIRTFRRTASFNQILKRPLFESPCSSSDEKISENSPQRKKSSN